MIIRHTIAALLMMTTAAFGQEADGLFTVSASGNPPIYDTTGVVSLRDYLMRMFDEKDRRDQQRFEAQEKALAVGLDNSKTAVAADLALKIQEQGQKFVEKESAKDSFDALDAKVDALTDKLQELQITSVATANVWALIVGAVGLLIGIGGLVVAFVPARRAK